jgi:hypothetical protein
VLAAARFPIRVGELRDFFLLIFGHFRKLRNRDRHGGDLLGVDLCFYSGCLYCGDLSGRLADSRFRLAFD